MAEELVKWLSLLDSGWAVELVPRGLPNTQPADVAIAWVILLNTIQRSHARVRAYQLSKISQPLTDITSYSKLAGR
jgi:hypothetical protein